MTPTEARFSEAKHLEAVIKRRIKFVVEKGAMARLFKKGVNPELQQVLRSKIDVPALKALAIQKDFDAWHREIVMYEGWAEFTERPIEQVRWGHFAKLANIVLYELVANNEIMTYEEAGRLRDLLHLPIDKRVLDFVRSLRRGVRLPDRLLGMTESDYRAIQQTIREEAARLDIPAIWFEDAWVSGVRA